MVADLQLWMYSRWQALSSGCNNVVGRGAGIKQYTRKISNIRRTKSQILNDSPLVLQMFLLKLLKPCVKSRVKM